MEKTYSIDPSLFELFPLFQRGVIVAENVDNRSEVNEELYDLFRTEMNQLRASQTDFDSHPRIKCWTDAYTSMGMASRKIKPSVLNLIGRIKKGKDIPFISPLVCISNLVSVKFLNPGGLIDSGKLSGNPRLGLAKGDERFLPFGADKEISPAPGEIIYYDDATKVVMCGAWNSKGGQQAMTEPATSGLILDIDTFEEDNSGSGDLDKAIQYTSDLLEKFCSANVISFKLSAIQYSRTFTIT